MSGPTDRADAGIGRAAWLVIGAVAAWHLIVGATLWLGDAEAYYWAWSRDLQANYLDHPPMIAVLVRLSTAAFGDTLFGVRLVPALLNAGSAWALARTTRTVGGSQSDALRTVAVAYLVPGFLASGIAASPDAPVLFFGSLVLLATATAIHRPRPADPLILGALLGFALLSKLSSSVMALSVLGLFAARRELRGRLLTPWFAAGLLLAAAVASPVLLWNLQHDWATWTYHGARPGAVTAANVGKLVAGQLAYYSPFLAVGAAACTFGLGRDSTGLRHLGWPSLLFNLYLILRARDSEPQWTALGYLPGIVILSLYILSLQLTRPRLVRAATVFSFALPAVALAAAHVHLYTDLGVRLMPASYAPRKDWSTDLVGWRETAAAVKEVAQPRPGVPVVSAAGHYTMCGQVAFATGDSPPMTCPTARTDAFDFILGRAAPPAGADVVYVGDDRFRETPQQRMRLERCDEPRVVEIRRAERVVRTFRIWRCYGYGGAA